MLEDINAAVTVPTFTPGTTEAVIVTAAKIDPNQSSQVKLEVADEAGNMTVCDPIIVNRRC